MPITTHEERVAAFMARLDAAERRLIAHASAAHRQGLTGADAATREQWDWGQVWAHLAEIVPYWTDRIADLLAVPEPQPKPFGRVKSDAARIAAIEAGRHGDVEQQLAVTLSAVEGFRDLLRRVRPGDWALRGLHAGQGDMTLERIIDFFVVGHLEEHADQLDLIAAGGAPAHPQ